MPQHIWKNILPENFSRSAYNLQPIGSGPYLVYNIEQSSTQFIKSLSLKANSKYYGKVPYISNVSFHFFNNKEELIKAVNQKTIDGFSFASLKENSAKNENFNAYYFSLPRYFAVFFNGQKNKILSDANITKALNYSVDKENLIEQIGGTLKEKISVVDSPILPEYFGYSPPTVVYDYSTEAAAGLFDKSGFKNSDSGQRTKADAKQPAFQFKSYLKQGSKGNEVTELQGCLSRLDENFKKLLENETNGTYGIGTENAVTEFQKKYLPETNPTGETGPGTRKKLNELCIPAQNNSTPLKFVLTTINQLQMIQVAEILKDFWQKVGVTIDIKTVELTELKDVIKYRNYEALLYGQALGSEPDLYPFWHSTQINDPGLNLAIYQNKNADQLLKDARETMDEQIKIQKYETLQNQIISDSPAVFLYNPDYIYWVSEKIKGIDTTKIIDPAKRFSNIENWHINTKRIWK
jgi:ABC-type transport system substrate-binding protein